MASSEPTALILVGTRRDRLASTKLVELGLPVRTAARHRADVQFDCNDPTTYRACS
jgi:hypothetical protein